MISPPNEHGQARVCAVSYLNTAPLVWGMLHGSGVNDGRGVFDLSFALPSECAHRLATGETDIGIVPVIEMARLKLSHFPGSGIACHGPVRSILLVSKVPFEEIRTLATDAGSRTSVMLARIILAEKYGLSEKYGAEPKLISLPPDLPSMLGKADAALIIGDPALRIDPATLPFEMLDLGGEWVSMTGLPMVFALWAGRKEILQDRYAEALAASIQCGLTHVNEIAAREAPARRITEDLAREYLTRHIVFELGERDYAGLNLFLEHASRFEKLPTTETLPMAGGITV